jgi:hypothetical protein
VQSLLVIRGVGLAFAVAIGRRGLLLRRRPRPSLGLRRRPTFPTLVAKN